MDVVFAACLLVYDGGWVHGDLNHKGRLAARALCSVSMVRTQPVGDNRRCDKSYLVFLPLAFAFLLLSFWGKA